MRTESKNLYWPWNLVRTVLDLTPGWVYRLCLAAKEHAPKIVYILGVTNAGVTGVSHLGYGHNIKAHYNNVLVNQRSK